MRLTPGHFATVISNALKITPMSHSIYPSTFEERAGEQQQNDMASKLAEDTSVSLGGETVHDAGMGAQNDVQGKKFTRWQRFKKKCFRRDRLIYLTILGVITGAALGMSLYHTHPSRITKELIAYPGEMLIRAFQELILPLVVFSLMVGILNLRHTPGGTRRVIRWALFYYILSMLLAVAVGIILVEIIKPWKHTSFASENSTCSSSSNSTIAREANADKGVVDSFLNIGRNLIPTNIVTAAAQPNYLGVILFSVVFAGAITTFGAEAEPLIQIIELCNSVIVKIIRFVILFIPIGVASVVAGTILKACNLGGLLKGLGLYVATVISGFFIHAFVVLPLIMLLLARQNPIKSFKGFLPALVMGLGTASSAATMPVTMQNAEENMRCEPRIVQFVIPLGTSINRDGAALYEAVSVIFILKAHGISMTAGNITIVVIAATLAAIGSASVPSSALVTMISVLQALGYPEYIPDVTILYAVDWFLGMLRTSLNIWGDATAVMVVDTWAKNYFRKHHKLPTSSNNAGAIHVPQKKESGLWESFSLNA